ncbi:MAG: S24/S26 family peptidase [Acidobacteriales bacterium]|nr:S24/S26 family peptidase [Terriglobales bacterium]
MSQPPRLERSELPLTSAALLDLMRAVLARGVPFRFRARGGSMSPFVRDGDIVTVEPAAAAPARTGDIVAFVEPATQRLRVHRVAATCGGAFLLKGDNVETPDGLVKPDGVLGKVVRVERDGSLVRLGTGPERGLIAWLSRVGCLAQARRVYRRCRKGNR